MIEGCLRPNAQQAFYLVCINLSFVSVSFLVFVCSNGTLDIKTLGKKCAEHWREGFVICRFL